MTVRRWHLIAALACSFPTSRANAQTPGPGPTAGATAVVRREIDRLASDDAGRRATAAAALGAMGAAAEAAVPWLVAAMADSREVLSPEYGKAEVFFVAGKALSKIGPPARKYVVSLITNPKTNVEMRRLAARAMTVMRDPTSVDVLLGAIPYAYGEVDPDGLFARWLGGFLECFLPDDRRVPEAFLRLEQASQASNATQRASHLRDFNNTTNQNLKTLGEAQEWWAQNKATASLRATLTVGECRK